MITVFLSILLHISSAYQGNIYTIAGLDYKFTEIFGFKTYCDVTSLCSNCIHVIHTISQHSSVKYISFTTNHYRNLNCNLTYPYNEDFDGLLFRVIKLNQKIDNTTAQIVTTSTELYQSICELLNVHSSSYAILIPY